MTIQAIGRDRDFTKIVHHSGRNFLASKTMAAIFSAHARDVIARNETELVPLLHSEGVDLLLIGPSAVFAVVNIEVGLHDRHTARGRGAALRPSKLPRAASA